MTESVPAWGQSQARERPRVGTVSAAEPCLRCGASMEWRHGTLQCPRCRFKVGCCEGATAECEAR